MVILPRAAVVDMGRAGHSECGFVEVPLDYAEPTGELITLAVSRVTHKGPDDQGPMLVTRAARPHLRDRVADRRSATRDRETLAVPIPR